VILSLVGLYSACTNDRQGLFLYYTGLMLMCGLLLYIGVYCLLFAENARSFELLYYKTRAPAELPNSKQAIEERAMAAVGSANPCPPCSTPSDEVVLALCAFIQWTRSQPSSLHSQVFGIFITAHESTLFNHKRACFNHSSPCIAFFTTNPPCSLVSSCSREVLAFQIRPRKPGSSLFLIPIEQASCDHRRAGLKHSLPVLAILISKPPRSPAGARSGVGWQPLRGDVGPSGGRPVCQLCPDGPQLRGQAHEHGHEPRHRRPWGLPALPCHPHHANQCRVSPHDCPCTSLGQALDPTNFLFPIKSCWRQSLSGGQEWVKFWARFGTPIQAVCPETWGRPGIR
jgi:hypothetical protein